MIILTKGQKLTIIISFFLVTATTLSCYGYIICVTTSLNFLVYGWQNKDFREAYKKILYKQRIP
ncbi:uncharacterized protein LOC126809534 [Patella vulgata]|uniref:uncharacterized protein LOC126809534 n=1 Tax=Patella vulgata TaxID=6465 RepID=UPI0021800208|nr:uncharacterized protein LOC126809534 [Patella vulgata]